MRLFCPQHIRSELNLLGIKNPLKGASSNGRANYFVSSQHVSFKMPQE